MANEEFQLQMKLNISKDIQKLVEDTFKQFIPDLKQQILEEVY
jgi:hypothetical protein